MLFHAILRLSLDSSPSYTLSLMVPEQVNVDRLKRKSLSSEHLLPLIVAECALFVVHTPSNGWRYDISGQCCEDEGAFGMEAGFRQSGGRVVPLTVLLSVRGCAVASCCCAFLQGIAERVCFWQAAGCVSLDWRVWGTSGRRGVCGGRGRVVRRDSVAVGIFAAAGSECSCVLCRAPVVWVNADNFDVEAPG